MNNRQASSAVIEFEINDVIIEYRHSNKFGLPLFVIILVSLSGGLVFHVLLDLRSIALQLFKDLTDLCDGSSSRLVVVEHAGDELSELAILKRKLRDRFFSVDLADVTGDRKHELIHVTLVSVHRIAVPGQSLVVDKREEDHA